MKAVAGISVRMCGVALVALALASTPAGDAAFAAGKGGSGKGGAGKAGASGGHRSGKTHNRHHHHHSRTVVGAGVFVGAPWWPWWDYPVYYPPVLATMPVTYIERSEQEGHMTDGWLYCPKALGYFPYVAECADGWERVPVAPLK